MSGAGDQVKPSRGMLGPRARQACALLFVVSVLDLATAHMAEASVQGERVQARLDRLRAAEATNRLDQLEERIDDLGTQVDRMLVPITILVGLLSAGGVIGIVTSFRNERRTSQIHELGVAGEVAAQGRAEQVHASFLDSSQKTLSLVNDTLDLAREASERAAETTKRRAKQSLAEIDERAQAVIESATGKRGFKELVEDSRLRTGLVEVAAELGSIEGYLQMQDVTLTPNCYFVKGMARHLMQEPKAAIQSLRRAIQDSKNRDLRLLAQFWCGYELNNLGLYDEAVETFRLAREHATADSPKGVELTRIMHESRFFELAAAAFGDARLDRATYMDGVRKALKRLLDELPDHSDLADARRRICSTLANVHVWMARPATGAAAPPAQRAAYNKPLLREARRLYDEAGKGLWPRFGQAEATYFIAGKVDPQEYEALVRLCAEALRNRVEPRSLANLHEAILVAQRRRMEAQDSRVGMSELEKSYNDLQASLGVVDQSMTIFSQFLRCNVTWQQFADETVALHAASPRPLPKTARKG